MTRVDIIKVSGTSADQRALWAASAAADGVSLAAWFRRAADASVHGSAVSSADIDRVETALRVIGRSINSGVGNNLNQIATDLNRAIKSNELPSSDAVGGSLASAAADLAVMRAELSVALALVRGLRS